MVKIEGKNKINPRVIVSDMDETLVNITPKWFSKVLENIHKHYDLIEQPDPEQLEILRKYPSIILLRSDYYLNKFFKIRKDIVSVNTAHAELNRRFLKYLEDPDFYLNIPLNPYGVAVDIGLSLKDKVEKFIVLTHSVNEVTDEAKRRFIQKHFNSNKVELVNLRLDQKKSEYLNSIQWGSFADDSFNVVMDVMENDLGLGHEIIVPMFNYNVGQFDDNREKVNELSKYKAIDLRLFARAVPDEQAKNLFEYREDVFGNKEEGLAESIMEESSN